MFIHALPHFKDTSDRLNELRELALYAIPLLLEDGLATPFAALWYTLGTLSADDRLFRKFPKAHIQVCKLSNRALRDHLAVPEKPTTAATIIIESSDEELTTEGALDLAMGPARSPPADIEMSSARPRRLAKDTSSLSCRSINERLLDSIQQAQSVAERTRRLAKSTKPVRKVRPSTRSKSRSG